MSVKFSWFLFNLILISIFQGAISFKKGYYTIVAPTTIRPESIFHVSFTLNDFHKSCWFNISLTSYPHHNQIYGLESIEVKPGTTKLVELHAPSFHNNTFGFLEVFGYRGVISKESDIVFLEVEKFWAFAQTDKIKYRPGELVQFRIICIDHLTRPAKLTEEVTVTIHDAKFNLLKTIVDIKFVQGVFRGEFRISENPTLGRWRIHATVGNNHLTYKDFDVVRYVLPKFNVLLVNTKEVSMYDAQMVFEIKASYFYGESVKGNLSITVANMYSSCPEGVSTLLKRESRIDGKSTIVLDLKDDLQIIPTNLTKSPTGELCFYQMEAIVIDDLSEEQARTVLEFAVYTKPYYIELQAPTTFDSDALLKIKVKVLITDLNGNSIEDPQTPIEIIVECSEKSFLEENYKPQERIRISYKRESGKDFGIIQVTNKNYSECNLHAEYQECISLLSYLKRKPTLFDMDILTESPQEGKEIEIKIKNPDPIEEFSYEIVSRGDIIQSDHVKVSGNETSYILRFNVSSAMVPKITIYAHFVKNKGFIGQLKDILIKRAFPNWIKITTDKETKPGKSVFINVTTEEGSYVGLMGLDPSALQSLEKKDILNDEIVNWQLGSVNSLNRYYQSPYYYRTEDILTFSNAIPPGYGGGEPDGLPTVPQKLVRKLFPESWLYMDFERTPAGGLSILETVPDSITTWALTGFSINPDTGLTFTRNITNLRVFQEFFISMDFPSLVKEGEIIEVPVYINNYMNQDALTDVIIESPSEDLEIHEHLETMSKSKHNISKLVSAKKSEKILFFMKPLKQGYYNVTIQALSSVASDAIRKTLKVQPQGIPFAMSKNYLVHLPEQSTQEDEITIDIPENAVSGSQRVEVSIVGDIFQPLMQDLQKLARVPYGNGEENMRHIVSNSIVLKYLKVLNYSNPSLESKLRSNIELGYQNQLSFKFLDGSFGLFDQKIRKTSDTWQTIFSLWGLEQANEFIPVDPDVINRGLEYLKSKQLKNGCLKSESGIEEDVKFTAFGMMVFLMDEHSSATYNDVIRKGLAFLYKTTDDLEDSPISVMATYALLLGKHEKAQDHLKKLTANSRLTEDKQKLWTRSDTLQSHLETIAGSLINLFESRLAERGILQVVRSLIVSKKEEHSIAHMIALQAMIIFVKKLFLTKTHLDIILRDDQGKSGDFQVTTENSQVLQTFEISQNFRRINLHSNGHGFAVVDVRYSYNLIPENETSSFYKPSISTKRTSKNLGVLKMCSSVLTNNTQNKLNVMEVNLQSGYIFTEKQSRDDENHSEDIKSVQVNGGRDKVVVYFEPIDNDSCIEMDVRQTFKVFDSRPGWVIVYGAHDKDQKATKSFMIDDFQQNIDINRN